ncbi:MAG TPA: hypothetical protein VHC20_01250 [Candidatus Paceibacterota bacterium]|nr:hypothetical protein [Candidatus Paceibacterota bacterium]
MSAAQEIFDLVADRYCNELAKQGLSLPASSITKTLLPIARGIIERELELPPVAASNDELDVAKYKDALARYQTKFSPQNADKTLALMVGTLTQALVYFTMKLPPYAFYKAYDAGPKIPLLQAFPDIAEPIFALIVPFSAGVADPQLISRNIFSDLTNTIFKNQLDSKGDLLLVRKFKGTPEETVQKYLADTPFLPLFDCQVSFQIPDETRFSGQWIIAPPGRGKSTLLHSMFLEDLKKNASIVVMDSKGDLIAPIKCMADVADRLVLIEPDVHHPLALNPLDVSSENVPHTIALIEYILSGLLEAKFTNLQSALFRHVLPAIMQAIERPTIEDLKRVLADGLTLEEIAELDDRLRSFFQDKSHGFYAKTYAETRSQIIWRLDLILTNDTMRAMFASPTTRLRIAEAMNTGKIIVIDASKAVLGDEGSEFYQRFFLALILAAGQQRAKLKPEDKLPVYVYLDECQWVRNDQKLATILDECRSQRIALILAHQRTEQITDKNVLSAMSNCAIRFANSDDEAKYLAPKLRCEPEFLCSLPRGTFAAFVRDLTAQAVALKIPYVNLDTLPRMTAEQQTAIRERMRTEYGFAPQQSRPSPRHGRASSTEPPDTPPANDAPESGSTW